MRKLVVSLIVLCLLGLITLVILKAKETSKLVDNIEVVSNIKKLPLFEFNTLDSISFTKFNLIKGKSLVIVYFDPDCDLCEKSGKFFYAFQEFHKDSDVLFISSNTPKKILNFQKRHNLESIPNITFLRSNQDDFFKLFNTITTPTYFIYNTKQILVKEINDNVPVETILRYIKASQIE